VLYYGCKLRLAAALPGCVELLPPRLAAATAAQPLRLASAPLTSTRFAPKSKRQLVYLVSSVGASGAPPADTAWVLLPGSGQPADGLWLEGTAVRLGDAVTLQHAPTARLLSCEAPAASSATAWAAAEGEVAAWTHAPSAGRTASLTRAAAGACELNIANRRVATQNVWRFEKSDAPPPPPPPEA